MIFQKDAFGVLFNDYYSIVPSKEKVTLYGNTGIKIKEFNTSDEAINYINS